MKQARSSALFPLCALTLAVSMVFSVAHADEYSDVNQLVRAGKLTDAMTKVDLHLANKPRDPQMRFLKGVIQRDTGKTADAIATFTRLTEDYPELPEPYNNLAVLYAGQSQFDKARTALEMAIRTNPSYATAHENLGDVYAKLASQAYNKALQLDASNPAVPPKLALIRELFTPNGAKNQRPGTVPTLAPVTTPAPAAIVAKAPPTLAGPLSAKPVETKPAPVAPAAVTPSPAAPVVTTSAPPTATPAPAVSAGNSTKEAEAAVRAWASAWAAKDVKSYLAAYGKEFVPPGGANRLGWETERKVRISSKSSISVKLEGLSVAVNGGKATAKFRQDYKAGGLAVSSHKTLDLVKNGERWQIVRESTGG
jgi:tetratricopeptide (TPR) repeat protein